MKRENLERARIRSEVRRLMDEDMPLSQIAELSGVDYQRLRNFSSKMVINPREFRLLRDWIDARPGGAGKAPEPSRGHGGSAIQVLVLELEALLKFMRSNEFDDATKLARFSRRVIEYYNTLEEMGVVREGVTKRGKAHDTQP